MKLAVKVIPSSSKDCIVGWLDETLKIKVKAPADKGKANKAVINVLEKSLNLARGSIRISSGATSGRKIVELNYENEDAIYHKLAALLNN